MSVSSPAVPHSEAFAIMANASPVMIWVTDEAGHLRFGNRAYRSFFGLAEEHVQGMDWQSRVHPRDVESYVRPFLEALEHRQPFRARCRFSRHDGMWRWVESHAAPYFSPGGDFLGMVGSSPDITEQIATEQALRESETRFRDMADNASVAIWVTDPDGTAIFLSKCWYEMTGQSPATGLGYGWVDALHPDDRGRVKQAFLAANARRESFRLEYRLRSRDGQDKWVIDAATPRFDGSGTFVGYIGSVIDISERKKAEEALEQANRRKDEFIATLAHELRNPLAPLRNALELIRFAGSDPTVLTHARELMERQVKHIVRLIDDLLDVSRIASGKLHLKLERVNLLEVISSAVEIAMPLMLARRHNLVVTVSGGAIWIECDTVRLTQAFGNVLANAAKFTPSGGRIDVGIALEDGRASIGIRDNGIGIPADKLESIFEMFAQLHERTDDREGGLGIGLHLVKRLVELHKGTVAAFSAGANQGTEIRITLPVVSTATVQEPRAPLKPAAAVSRKVLVIDDNIDAADSIAMVLDVMGHEAKAVYDGVSGFSAAQEYKPDIVLLDLDMPNVSGYEVARQIKATAWGKTMLVAALTGYGQEEDRRETAAAGFDYHFVKPIDPKELQWLLAKDSR